MEGGIADCSVGTIVWVRRRNGSWWPGRILGPEELSASHLMSPRSGTPVKLLGREDASVDWYNLEKSKRVKTFRCGEFDACIERAEASQGIPIKKREKYARREDAILHALELEKQQLETKHQKLGIVSNGISNKTSGARRRGLNSFPSSDNYLRDDDSGLQSKFVNHKSQMFFRNTGSSRYEEDDLYVHKGKSSKQTGWTEYNPETQPRMRGLQDFGLRAAPPKKMLPESTWETSYKPVNNHVGSLSDSGLMMGSPNHAGGSKRSLAIKRKRPQGGISKDSLVKKRDRRWPVVQVLQSSAKSPVPHTVHSGYDSGAMSMHGERDNMGAIFRAKRSRCMYLPADSNESLGHDGYPSEQMPNTESEFGTGGYLDHTGGLPEEGTSSESDETGSDSSESDEYDTDENTLADATPILLPGSKNCDPPAVHIPENFGEVKDDEKPHPGYIPQSHAEDPIMDVSADVGVSKWHMKGKRNIRNLPKRPMDPITSADKCNGSINRTSYERSGSSFKKTSGRRLYHKKEASCYAFDGVDKLERDGQDQLIPYGNQRYSFALQTKDRGRSQSSFNDSDSDSHQLSPSRWEEAYADHLGDDMEPMLINVELKVQAATYQGEHVPLVSLMSRLNGKAIIGHPVQIEILEDGSSGRIVTKYESNAPPAVWKTARRSAMHRIPRSHPVSSTLEGEDHLPQNSDPESKPSPKKAYSGYSNHRARLAKMCISHAKRPLVPGKFQKKLSKKVNFSNQKTRKLSSLATEQRRKFLKLSRQSGILDGLIKPDGGAPLVTCIPAKVVFGRILETIGGPTSASAHRARIASPANPP